MRPRDRSSAWLLALLLCLGRLQLAAGDDVYPAEYDSDLGLATDDELQCTDNYCCKYDASLNTKCPLSSLPDTGTSMIFPGGNTRCLKSYSTPYAFQVHKGAKDKLLFYFQGGGSCWDEKSTNSSGRGKKQGTYCRTDAVPWPIYGVFDKSDPRNAYKEYTIVNVLYCSGDNHAGDAVRSYVDEHGQHIVQRGAANTESVIEWVQAQQLSGELALQFEDFVIMGCSAGALASQIWGNELVDRFNYPVRTAIVADSYLGVFPGSVEGEIIYDLGMCSLSFMSQEFKEACLAKNASTVAFVTTAMRNQPKLPYLYMQSRYDRVQVKYYNFLAEQYGFAEIDGAEFEVLADDMVKIYNTYPNFIAYFVDSNQHCYTPTPYVYFADTGGLNGYASDDDEMGGGRDDDGNMDIDLYEETMNRWLTRAPLSPGDSISSQCDDADCTTYNFIPKYFLQTALEASGVDGSYQTEEAGYSPSKHVRSMHKLPHYDSSMMRVDNDFNISSASDPWGHSYTQSLLPFPIMIYLLGVFAVVVFQSYLICRRAMGYNPYAKASSLDDDEEEYNDAERILYNKKRGPKAPTNMMIGFQALLICAFVANFLIFVGDVNLNKGTATADRAMDKIDHSLEAVADISDGLSVSGANVTQLFGQMEALGCDDAALLAGYSAEFETVVEDLSSILSPLEPYVRKSNNVLESWVKKRKNQFIWVTFSLNTICMGLFAYAFHKKSALGLQLTLVLTELIVLLNMIFGIVYMVSLMGASDFCMHPTDYAASLASSDESRETLTYYATCSGANPTADYVHDAEYNINVMSYFVSYLGTSSCPDLDYLANQVQWNLDQIYTNFNQLTDLSECDAYMPYWEEFLYDGVCTHAFDGMYLIWITQTLCAVFLFGAAMCSSAIFPYFIELKKLGFESDMMSSHGKASSVSSGDGSIVSSLSSGTARQNPTMAPWQIERGNAV